MEEYLSRDDARLRLHQTVCLYKGKPVYVRLDNEDHETPYECKIWELSKVNKGVRAKTIDYRDKDFNAKEIELGYCQAGMTAVYLSRLPVRQNQQGLKHDNILSEPGNIPYEFYSDNMEHCIIGKHRPLKTALAMLNDGYEKIPLSRILAVGWLDRTKIALYYKEQIVALKEDTTNRFNIISSKTSSFVMRIIDKQGVLIND